MAGMTSSARSGELKGTSMTLSVAEIGSVASGMTLLVAREIPLASDMTLRVARDRHTASDLTPPCPTARGLAQARIVQ